MGRFNNVKVLMDTAEDYNQDNLVEILLDEDNPTEELAEDIAFVVISMWSMVPTAKKLAFKERLTDEMVNIEIAEMFTSEVEFRKDTNCTNCGGAMWWVPEEGWYHNHPHCIDPEPYMGEI